MPSSAQSSPAASLTPAALSILGLEQAGFIPSHRDSHRSGGARSRNGRHGTERRVMSYYNQFSSRSAVCHDAPPTYATAASQTRFPPSPRHLDNGNEVLPRYTCTVFKEGPMQFRLESCSPFLILPFQEWRQCYVRIHGTMLCIHKLKTTTVDKAPVHSAGRLLRKYTLQHAEVGVASDVAHSILVPMTRLASLIPLIARKRAAEKDPELFHTERHHCLRVRSELDQFVLSSTAEDQIISWVNHISAGIDIAPDLDCRNIPKQCTMPRRSRRQQRTQTVPDLTDERLVEQQRRLLAQYPSLADGQAEAAPAEGAEQRDLAPTNAELSVPSRVEVAAVLPDQEQEDIDLTELAEESSEPRNTSVIPASGPRAASRLNSQILTPSRSASAVPPSNFDEHGKWTPPHPRSASQQWRYIRRCMPVLLAETPRHSSVMIEEGRYVRPNYKLDMLEGWTLMPPTYEAHGASAESSSAEPTRHNSVSAPATREVSLVPSAASMPALRPASPSDDARSTASTLSAVTPASEPAEGVVIRRVDSTGAGSDGDDGDDGDDDLLAFRRAALRLIDGRLGLGLKARGTSPAAAAATGLLHADASSGSDSEGDYHPRGGGLLQIPRPPSANKSARRGASRSSPNLTMRSMGKPGAVLGF